MQFIFTNVHTNTVVYTCKLVLKILQCNLFYMYFHCAFHYGAICQSNLCETTCPVLSLLFSFFVRLPLPIQCLSFILKCFDVQCRLEPIQTFTQPFPSQAQCQKFTLVTCRKTGNSQCLPLRRVQIHNLLLLTGLLILLSKQWGRGIMKST